VPPDVDPFLETPIARTTYKHVWELLHALHALNREAEARTISKRPGSHAALRFLAFDGEKTNGSIAWL